MNADGLRYLRSSVFICGEFVFLDFEPTAERNPLPVNCPGRTAAFRAPRPQLSSPAPQTILPQAAGLSNRLGNSGRMTMPHHSDRNGWLARSRLVAAVKALAPAALRSGISLHVV
jgi:hypothetical protein